MYARFEARLCASLHQPPIDWPSRFGAFESRAARSGAPDPTLPHIAPGQALLLTPLTRLDRDAARVYWAALDTSFGADADWPVPDETMQRLLTPHLPEPWRPRWTAGLGLEPPSIFRPPAEQFTAAALASIDGAQDHASVEGSSRAMAEIAFIHATIDLAASLSADERSTNEPSANEPSAPLRSAA